MLAHGGLQRRHRLPFQQCVPGVVDLELRPRYLLAQKRPTKAPDTTLVGLLRQRQWACRRRLVTRVWARCHILPRLNAHDDAAGEKQPQQADNEDVSQLALELSCRGRHDQSTNSARSETTKSAP